MLEKQKSGIQTAFLDTTFFSKRLFFFIGCLQALSTNFQIFSVNFLGLKIDGHGSFGGDVGVGAALGGFGSAAANLANSAHVTCNM
jgi:hypothetical protein